MVIQTQQSVLVRCVVRTSYPLTICTVLFLYWILAQVLSSTVSAYIVVLFGSLIITVHEWKVPYQSSWHPTRFDLVNDATYMVLGQILLERLLFFIAFFVVVSLTGTISWEMPIIWPHNWPIWLQAILLLAAGDFFRYWLHRMFHSIPWMWCIHQVHHSPKRLYWVNVGRFHPIEQAMQFVVDALPFVLIGVHVEVISVYFVFYAINGFYQHSNCDVRLGPLNWIVAGPELHRWHHSLDLEESNHNYGNNLIVWDTLFGTRFLPKEREIGELGIPIPDYPMSFLRQLVAPFRRFTHTGS